MRVVGGGALHATWNAALDMRFLTPLLEEIRSHGALLGWLLAMSLAMLLVTPLAVAWVVVRLPTDYFCAESSIVQNWRRWHPLLGVPLLVGKNVLGGVLVLAGIAMLFAPGQGMLTLAVGLGLIDFPGKRRLMRALVRQRSVWRTVNWLRRRAGRPVLRMPT